MLRELDANEMTMVSGGDTRSYQDHVIMLLGWNDGGNPIYVTGSNGSGYVGGGGGGGGGSGWGGAATGMQDFNPGVIVGADVAWYGTSPTTILTDREGNTWADIDRDGSVDGLASLFGDDYWVDTDDDGTFETNVGRIPGR